MLAHYHEFVKREREEETDTIMLERLETLMQNKMETLSQEIEFIVQNCDSLVSTTKKLMGRNIQAPFCFNEIDHLLSLLKSLEQNDLNSKVRKALQMSIAKVSDYHVVGGKQPGLEFVKSLRIFDHRCVTILSHDDVNSAQTYLHFTAEELGEFSIYLNLGRNAHTSLTYVNFWKGASTRIPKLFERAVQYAQYPFNTVDVERSISQYKTMMRKNRMNLK